MTFFYFCHHQPNPNYVCVKTWWNFKTFDSAHPRKKTSKRAALMTLIAILPYNKIPGKRSLYSQ